MLLTADLLKGDFHFWLAANAALVVVFAAHNIFEASEIRYATFVQLALLRFALPIMFSLPNHALTPVIIITFLHYLYFRGLAYLESKGLLAMPRRKDADFGFRHTVVLSPIIACLYLATEQLVYPAAWGYTAAVYGAFALFALKRA